MPVCLGVWPWDHNIVTLVQEPRLDRTGWLQWWTTALCPNDHYGCRWRDVHPEHVLMKHRRWCYLEFGWRCLAPGSRPPLSSSSAAPAGARSPLHFGRHPSWRGLCGSADVSCCPGEKVIEDCFKYYILCYGENHNSQMSSFFFYQHSSQLLDLGFPVFTSLVL